MHTARLHSGVCRWCTLWNSSLNSPPMGIAHVTLSCCEGRPPTNTQGEVWAKRQINKRVQTSLLETDVFAPYPAGQTPQ
ncbi:unnamed protein product [Vitrella brassicaformis CCMP3155]|uniref:Uncharacterized protein n=1 Tax=Vitrella brassicaformis (strain CCMP3155) TaxID=1169540 RepID=A0A0G4H5G5_VITBC|nr:unnamed protein product [Vitrella brassicaformis CCMP3155]|eukprot:CEM39036.1 unnamed protein product [Vitrella brassicaformis CCMP3155]